MYYDLTTCQYNVVALLDLRLPVNLVVSVRRFFWRGRAYLPHRWPSGGLVPWRSWSPVSGSESSFERSPEICRTVQL